MGRRTLSGEEKVKGEFLGKAVSEIRTKASETQASLAEKAGVDLDALRGLEQGRYAHPSFFTVMAIARSLGVSAEQLLLKAEQKKRT